jgi:hypothetical protein
MRSRINGTQHTLRELTLGQASRGAVKRMPSNDAKGGAFAGAAFAKR